MSIKVMSVFGSLMAVSGVAFASNGSLVAAPTEKLFIPLGFDDNDNIEVIVNGEFKNTCYKVGPSDVKVDLSQKTVRVSPQSYEYSNAICAQMMVPFVQAIKVGSLPAGSYKVIVENNPAIAPQQLVVRQRFTESPDDFIYAPVESAEVEFGATSAEQSLTIAGSYPLTFVGCALVREVQVKRTNDILVVLPIMELLTNDAECSARGWTPKFTLQVPITDTLQPGHNLLHVRVTNGNSYNKLIAIEE